MARRSASLLLRVLGDGDDGRRMLAAMKADVRQFGKETAEAVVGVNTTKGRVDISAFKRELDSIARAVTAEVKLDAPTTAIERLRAEIASVGEASRDTIIDVQVQAAEQKIARVRQRLRDLAQQPDSPEIVVRTARASAQLETLEAKLERLNGRRTDVPVVVDDAQAKTIIDRVRAELTEFGALSPQTKLDIQIAEAEGDVARFKARLGELASERPTIEVRAQVAGAIAQLDQAQAKADRLNGQRADLNVNVNEGAVSILDRIASAASRLLGSLGGAGGGGGGLGDATVRVSAGFVSFGSVIGPIALILAGLVITIGVSLVGALAALIASLAAAAAAVGALGAALIAALGPGVALAIAVASRLAKVVGALKAQDAAAAQFGQQTAQGAAAATAATQRQEAAATGLKDAYQRLGEAGTQALREMADAAEAASDAVRGVDDAKLSLEDARLSTREAELALKKLRDESNATGPAFSAVFERFKDVNVDTSGLRAALREASQSPGAPTELGEEQELRLERAILTVRQARQREKTAVDGVSDAERNRNRTLETHNRFVRDGIAASAGYAAALRGVRDAQRQVNAAQKDASVSAAQAKAITLVQDLTARERELLDAIREVRKELRGAFRGATDAVFGGMIRALLRVPQLVNPLRSNFRELGLSISRALDIFSRELIQPAWISAIRAFTDAGGRIAVVFTGDILVPFLRIVRDIALAALPALERGLAKVGALLRGFSSNTGPTQLRDAIRGIVSQLSSWLALAGQVSRVFLAFVRAGAGEGQKLVDTITRGTRRLADFLNTTAGQNKLQAFFRDVIPLAREFLRFIGLLVIGAAQFVQQVAPYLATILGLFNSLIAAAIRFGGILKVAFGASPLAPLGRALGLLKGQAQDAGRDVANAMSQAAANVKRADNDLADAQRGAAQAQRDLTDARKTAKDTLEDLASSAANAELSRKDARLGLKEARDQLAADKARGATGDELARSQLNVAQAQQRLRDATRDATRAKKESNEAHRRGIEGDAGVIAATKRRADEVKRAAEAERVAARVRIKAAEDVRAARARDKADDDQGTLGKVASGVGKVAAIVNPFAGLAQVAAPLFDPVKKAAGDALSTVASTLGQIVGKADELGGRMMQAGRDLVGDLARGIAARAPEIAAGAGRLVTGAITRIGEFAGRVTSAGANLASRLVTGIGSAARSIASTAGRLITGALERIQSLGGRFAKAGIDIAGRLARGIVSGLAGLGKAFGNTLIGAVNFAINKINKLIPDKLGKGKFSVSLPKNPIPRIPELALGGLAQSATLGIFGEAGDEAILPLNAATMRRLAGAIVAQLELPAPRITLSAPAPPPAAARAAAGPGGVHIAHQDVHLPPSPGGAIADHRLQAILFAREMNARGG